LPGGDGDMSWASYERRLPEHVHFTQTWGNKPGLGRYWKREMHQARRRYWREMIRRGYWCGTVAPHPRTPARYEREVNWRTW